MILLSRWILLPLLVLASGLSGQEGQAYITKLDANLVAGHVRLTWKDAVGFTGAKYEIWRSPNEIAKDSLPSAQLLSTVAAGVMQFDDLTVSAPSYYLVLLKDADGNRRNFFIPDRNKTTSALGPAAADPKAPATVSGLTVTLSGKTLQISFRSVPAEKKVSIYRTTIPVKSLTNLKDATLLGSTTGSKSPWVDSPPPGLDFYYSVVDASALASNTAGAFSSANTTEIAYGFPLVKVSEATQTAALSAALRPAIDQSLRPLPVPKLTFFNDPVTGQVMATQPATQSPAKVSPETEKVLSAWTKGVKVATIAFPAPRTLAEESAKGPTGNQKLLSQTVQAYFLQKDWKSSVDLLNQMLTLDLEAGLEARVHFYLGQSLAGQKSYRKAFLELLAARTMYRVEVQDMIDSLFTLLPSSKD